MDVAEEIFGMEFFLGTPVRNIYFRRLTMTVEGPGAPIVANHRKRNRKLWALQRRVGKALLRNSPIGQRWNFSNDYWREADFTLPNRWLKSSPRSPPSEFVYGDTSLNAELSQMMVDMFVHENGPLLRIERTEKRVWVLRTAFGALGGEAFDCCNEPRAFALEFALCRVR